MKLTRKLIPAMIMLLVSAVLMSTASYAWFAMNTSVTATGMQVNAKSDSIFLEITGSKDSGAWKTVGTNEFTAELLPAAHESMDSAAAITVPGNWFYKYASDPTKSEASDAGKTTLTGLEGYVASTTYSIRLNPNMVNKAYDLYVSSIQIPKDTGISVIITCEGSNKYQEFFATESKAWASDDDNVADTLDMTAAGEDKAFTITVYIYINGADGNVYTNNATNLKGAISFTLSASGDQRTAQGGQGGQG